MRTLVVALVILIGLSWASRALGQAGVNLGWSSCGTTSTTHNKGFECDRNDTTFRLVGSFKLAQPLSGFIAIRGRLFANHDWRLPDWWRMAPGECREGAIRPVATGIVMSCTNPWGPASGQSGALWFQGDRPDYSCFAVEWSRTDPVGLAPGIRYLAFVLEVDARSTVADGSSSVCEGCLEPARIVLYELEVIPASGPSVILTMPEVRFWATWQGGGSRYCSPLWPCDGGGPCGTTAARNATWGRVKATYR